MSNEPFNKLVKLTARAFYDDITTKGDNQPKITRSDNRGIAVVILDALTRRQWVREEDLAKDLRLHSKQLRRILRFFEEEKLVMRDHRRETAKGAKIHNAAVAATADGQHTKEGEEKIKMHTHSYCCLDYAQIYDVVRYRLHRVKKKLKDELDDKNTVQEYICPNCGKRYNALDAARLVSMEDEYFHCESCNGELVAESDKLAAQELGEGDDNARRRRREKLRDMFSKIELQLKPLVEQLSRVKDLPPPDYGSLLAWEAMVSAAARGRIGDGSSDASRSVSGLGGTTMPFLGETKVEVALPGLQAEGEDSKSEIEKEALKPLPPWMITAKMGNLAKEQPELMERERKVESSTSQTSLVDDKKPSVVKDEPKSIQDEYLKAYYAAVYKRQQQQEEAGTKQEDFSNVRSPSIYGDASFVRQVGMKVKRDADEDVNWEEPPPPETKPKVDLNVEAEEEEDEDEVEWEDG
ncbi:hypothetical protein Dimus_009329 [Dionaea muscipula]